jgi:hypothetical protein
MVLSILLVGLVFMILLETNNYILLITLSIIPSISYSAVFIIYFCLKSVWLFYCMKHIPYPRAQKKRNLCTVLTR